MHTAVWLNLGHFNPYGRTSSFAGFEALTPLAICTVLLVVYRRTWQFLQGPRKNNRLNWMKPFVDYLTRYNKAAEGKTEHHPNETSEQILDT